MNEHEMPYLYLGAGGVVLLLAFFLARGSGASTGVTPGTDPKLYAAQVDGYNAQVNAESAQKQFGADVLLKYQSQRDAKDQRMSELSTEREKAKSDDNFRNKQLDTQNQQVAAEQQTQQSNGFWNFLLEAGKFVVPFFFL